jgi:hypothetical protein
MGSSSGEGVFSRPDLVGLAVFFDIGRLADEPAFVS